MKDIIAINIITFITDALPFGIARLLESSTDGHRLICLQSIAQYYNATQSSKRGVCLS